jgi:vacuolar-type H+-ATPase subunit E/Vma4
MAIEDKKAQEAAAKARETASKARETIENAKAQAQAKLADAQAKVAEAKAKVEAAKKKAKEIAAKAKAAKELIAKQKKKLEDLKKAANDKVNFLKDQAKISPAQVKALAIAILLPILTKFINAEKAANAIINSLISKTKKQLKNKGRVEVTNGTITFTPKNPGNYETFKANFDRKVKNLKTIVKILKANIDALSTLLKIMKAALTAVKVYSIILKAKMKRLAAKAAAEAASPSPSKPANAEYLAFKEINDPIITELEKKVDDYASMITAASAILSVFQKLVNKILDKLNTLQFIINQPNTLTSEIISIDIPTTETSEYEYTSTDNKEYIIRVITTPSGAKQAIAYDKFSNFKITQTAPSLVRNEDELFEELKQILG